MQSVASQVTQSAGNVFDVAKDVFQQVFTTVKPAVDVATPYVQKSADYAIKSVVPFATDLEQQAEKALQSNGLNTKPVLDAAKVMQSTQSSVVLALVAIIMFKGFSSEIIFFWRS